MEDKDSSSLPHTHLLMAVLCNQIGFSVAGVLQNKINRLVVNIELQFAESGNWFSWQDHKQEIMLKLQTVLSPPPPPGIYFVAIWILNHFIYN